MQAITALSLICAILVLALLWGAVYAYRKAENARTDGYNEGYGDADRATERELEAQSQYIDRLHARTRQELSREEVITLRIAVKQLLVAAQTYSNLKLEDQARFAATAAERIEALADRLYPVPAVEDRILEVAASQSPNGKSWLVHGPQGCGKTRNAQAIAKALGLIEIVDDWHPGMPVPKTKALVLTNETGPFEPFSRRVLSFDQAMSLVASKQEAAA